MTLTRAPLELHLSSIRAPLAELPLHGAEIPLLPRECLATSSRGPQEDAHTSSSPIRPLDSHQGTRVIRHDSLVPLDKERLPEVLQPLSESLTTPTHQEGCHAA